MQETRPAAAVQVGAAAAAAAAAALLQLYNTPLVQLVLLLLSARLG
jgi:cobalamin biosynthesis protein CbiD